MWSETDATADRSHIIKRGATSGQRNRVSRLLIRYLQRNSARIAVTILLVQIVYIVFKLDIKVVRQSNRDGRSIGGDVDYVYNYAYENKIVPKHVKEFGRKKNRAESVGVVRGRNVPGARGVARIPVVVYDEDYDHLDGDGDHALKKVVEVKHEKPDVPVKKVAEVKHEIPDVPVKKVVEVKHEMPDIPLKQQAEVPVNMVPLQRITPAPKPETPKPPDPTIRVCTMSERLRHIKKYCDSTDTGDKRPDYFRRSRYGGLLVDEKHKLLFCDVSQAPSILFTTILAKATGIVKLDRPPVRSKKYMNKIGLKYLDSYTDKQRDDIIEGYFKFMVVQHPFDRLVQTWQSKLIDTNPYDSWRRKLGHQIILAHRRVNNKPIRDEEISSHETAYFEEFTEFVFVDRDMLDPSWFTYLQVCHPCEFEYDAVVRVESLKQDADVILSQIKDYKEGLPTDLIKVPTDLDLLYGQTYLKRFQNVSSASYGKLFSRFQHDFGMFGYKWDSKHHNATCSIATTNGVCC